MMSSVIHKELISVFYLHSRYNWMRKYGADAFRYILFLGYSNLWWAEVSRFAKFTFRTYWASGVKCKLRNWQTLDWFAR